MNNNSDIRNKYFSAQEIKYIDTLVPILIENRLYKAAVRLSNCGRKYNRFRCNNFHTHSFEHQYDIAFPYYCEQPVCPRCTRIRAYKLRYEIQQILKSINETKTNKFMLLSLTKKKTDISRLSPALVKRFNKHVRKLINRLYPKSKHCGALSVLEFGKNFGIHAHVIVFGPYYDQKFISRKWREITKDSYIVDIRAIRGYKEALNYLLKYISKPPKFVDLEYYPKYLKAIRNVRRVHRYGIFYNFKVHKRESIKCPICGSTMRYVSTVDEQHLDYQMGYIISYYQIIKDLGLNFEIERK